MPKIETNSVDYNSLIGTDFKNVASSSKGVKHHVPAYLLAATALIGILIVSVVLAQSNQTTTSAANLSATVKSNVTTLEQTNVSNQTISLPLKPVTEQSQSQTLALQVPSKNNQENLITNSSAETLEIVEPEPIAEASDVTVIVKKGDTLSSIFSDLDIHHELTQILNLGKQAKPLKKIYPGQKLHFTFGGDGIDKLELEKSITKSLILYKDNDTFIVEEANRELDRISQVATGTINQSLFLAGQDAGMSDGLIMGLAGIFGWDVDFALDIRQGDSFTVVYEELFLAGEKVGDGNIIAAEFANNNHIYRAYRYTDSNDKTEYYSPDGKSMRKPFMRTPVDLARISSRFNLRRKHPVLNKIRAHKGVDYAASTGTAIKATGDGKVVHRGRKGGYGNTIILRHGNTYTTLYAHMSKYAGKARVGSRVKQGQIIGYIGSTGLATGPHLHYEFRVNGVHRNPLKVKLPSANPLPDSEMDRFQASIQPMIVQLDAYTQNALVMRDL
ncbi:MAG: peptidoglycan DD-metalloendopeptidase family protein [Gammaproteobacteria bacterium]|nr:MAG: peptidoglycan DD-metalloendopeptidase family protein [Gammaproteobacteria bacterium]